MPTGQPTGQPTREPTGQPTSQPTTQPSSQPSSQPTAQPSVEPTGQPTSEPSGSPTIVPSGTPTQYPTVGYAHVFFVQVTQILESVSLSATVFNTEAYLLPFRMAVANVTGVRTSDVTVISVTDLLETRRRRRLTAGDVVGVTVEYDIEATLEEIMTDDAVDYDDYDAGIDFLENELTYATYTVGGSVSAFASALTTAAQEVGSTAAEAAYQATIVDAPDDVTVLAVGTAVPSSQPSSAPTKAPTITKGFTSAQKAGLVVACVCFLAVCALLLASYCSIRGGFQGTRDLMKSQTMRCTITSENPMTVAGMAGMADCISTREIDGHVADAYGVPGVMSGLASASASASGITRSPSPQSKPLRSRLRAFPSLRAQLTSDEEHGGSMAGSSSVSRASSRNASLYGQHAPPSSATNNVSDVEL